MCIDDETPTDDGPSYVAGCVAFIAVGTLAVGIITALVALGLP